MLISVSAVMCVLGAGLVQGSGAAAADDAARPTGVILIIADGMGLPMLSTASELARQRGRDTMAIESMRVIGLVDTSSASSPITDSAASATAMATGVKAANSAVGWFRDGVERPTIVELAEGRGMATALLTTTDLTDATPAAWVARAPDRKQHAPIFAQMVGTDVDIMGGGLRTASLQTDGRPKDLTKQTPVPLSPELRRRSVEAGRLVLTDAAALPPTTGDATRILLAFPERAPYDDAFGPPMERTLRAVLPVLATDPDGFFVVVEIEETDNAGHANDTPRAVDAVIEVDDAVRAALDFQRDHPGVLVLLTSDHDTGAFSYDNEGVYTGSGGKPVWVSANHTATRVPIYASGPGAERFGGFLDNTEIFGRLADLMSLRPGAVD
jgi:alkaline phosphatase